MSAQFLLLVRIPAYSWFYRPEALLEASILEVSHYMFRDRETQTLLTAEERFCCLATNPPPACLVCIQLLLDVANGEPIYGEPFVMVIASPMASPQGQLSRILDIWPGQLALQPIGYTLDTLDEDSDIVLAAASLKSASRTFTSLKVTSTFDSNLEETIYTLAGIELCESGFVLTSAPMQSGTEHFYGQSQQKFQRLDVSERSYLGTGDLQTQLASASHQIQVLRVMFPLPFAHSIPIGQIFSPHIGSRNFRKAIMEMAGNSVATSDICNSLQWIDNMQLLHNWLDAVAVNPGQFCVPCMARASIAGSPGRLKVRQRCYQSILWPFPCGSITPYLGDFNVTIFWPL